MFFKWSAHSISSFLKNDCHWERILPEQQATLLIVDDDPVNIRVLGHGLIDKYRVLTAKTGKTALSIIEAKKPPDLVLLDVQLPDIDGYEICNRIKSNPKTRGIAVIFLTGQNSVQAEAKGLGLGAADYITKPFSVPIVQARVRNQILLKRRTDLLEKLVSIDALTEIPNRRFFKDIFHREVRRLAREKGSCALLMIDIDHFKLYNDHYGHHAGDECLRLVAKTIQKALKRSTDHVARYGGEEFAALISQADLQMAETIAESLRKAIFDLHIEHEMAPLIKHITTSIGVTYVPVVDSLELTDLVKYADEMLYKAKQKGRNTFCVCTTSS